ncbi:MAG: hypothetical protein JNL28_04035 [Planctomycetes bacterium]|nr:hypothetical protein [Planctomycetota bacterium]
MKQSITLVAAALVLSTTTALAQSPVFIPLPTGLVPTDVSTHNGNVVVVGTSSGSGGAFMWTPLGGAVEIGSSVQTAGGLVRISRDGTTIVGEDIFGGLSQAAIWAGGTTWNAVPALPGSSGTVKARLGNVNGDGTVIVGLGYSASNAAHPFKWTNGVGTIDLQPFFSSPTSRAFGVSDDGAVIAGWEDASVRQGARWVGGVRTLFTFSGQPCGEANAVSSDGTIIVGTRTYSGGANAWRWDSGTDTVTALPNLAGETTPATATSIADGGLRIVGTNGQNVLGFVRAILWENNVPTSLYGHLITLGTAGLGGFPDIGFPYAISPDGGAIVGRGLGVGQPGGWVVIFPELLPNGTPFCAGDGSGAACPCGNASPLGAGEGCLSSLNVGGKLRATGVASVSADTLFLKSTQVPNGPALYFQGSGQQAGGAGTSFGDGLLCVGGSIVRLGVKFSTGNNSSVFPVIGVDPLISVQGLVAPSDVRHYQAWYRDAVVGYCTSAVFNLTDGLTITWGS